jgi:hypothetical protein
MKKSKKRGFVGMKKWNKFLSEKKHKIVKGKNKMQQTNEESNEMDNHNKEL